MNRLFILLSLALFTTNLFSQEFRVWEADEDDIIVCPHSDHIHKSYSPKLPIATKKSIGKPVEFIPNYIGVPQDFRSTVEFAFEQISMFISSEVPIYVRVEFSDMGGADGGGLILASAGPGAFSVNFPGAEILNTVYPIALAEKLANQELNPPGASDLNIFINSNDDVNFNVLPNNPQIGTRSDLATVLMHEVIHGLGFTANTFVDDDGRGFIGSTVYGIFLEDNFGDNLIDSLENGSTELGDALTGNSLFFNSPQLRPPSSPRIHAPSVFNGGSSISHLATSFNTTDDRLMTPAISGGDTNYDPGVSAVILDDMGWITTNIIHEQEFFNEDASADYDFTASLRTDDVISPTEIILHVSTDTFNTEEFTQVVPFGTLSDDYFFSIAARNQFTMYQYFFEVIGADGTIASTPKLAPDDFFQYISGPDTEAPLLSGHIPLTTIRDTDTQFTLTINDDFSDTFTGVDISTLAVVVSQNGILDTIPFVLASDDFGDFFEVTVTGNYSAQDELLYKIILLDNSINRNEGQLPIDEEFFVIDIRESTGAVVSYSNNFDVESNDFTGAGFQIIQPNGFESPAIHSDHPYLEAGGSSTIDFTFELAQLIRIDEENPTIVYDEIALIEIGEPGTSCNGIACDQQFWDYVVVEGRRPTDENWQPFLDAFDSRDQFAWRIAQGNLEDGTPSLYREREIDMTENGNFQIDDEIFIRFRLFSDPAANGWGWAIENLQIQPIMTSVLDEELLSQFEVFPNPAFGDQILNVDIDFTTPLQGQVNFMTLEGRLIWQDNFNGNSSIDMQYVTSRLPAGTYIIQIASTEGNSARKVVISK